jgi:FlaA1/EpsC-like NDP-sugar epimerase
MAEQMIRFYGFEPERDIKIEYIGTRPGERIDEKLWSGDEEPEATNFERILKLKRNCPPLDMEKLLETLAPVVRFDPQQAAAYRNSGLLRNILFEAVSGLVRE